MKLAEGLYLVAALASVGGLISTYKAGPILPWVVVGMLGFLAAVVIHTTGWLGSRPRRR